MSTLTRVVLVAIAIIALVLPMPARADEQEDLKQKIEQLSR